MKIQQLYDDFNVQYVTEGHKHSRPGWVNVECPFCVGNPGLHLGYSIEEHYFYCWRCGWHPPKTSISKILNIDEKTASTLIQKYGGRIKQTREKSTPTSKRFSLPTGCGPMLRSHKQYLADRGFDPDRLESEWGLLGTGPLSQLDGAEYRRRIIAPVRWDEDTVSFQGRDITDLHHLKYKACPKDREIIHHKKILYGKQKEWTNTGICVEGITDVWRLGVHSCATFGVKYTATQVRVLAKTFTRIFILFDPDPKKLKKGGSRNIRQDAQSTLQGEKLFHDLKYKGVDVQKVLLEMDPGSMAQSDADYLMKQLTK